MTLKSFFIILGLSLLLASVVSCDVRESKIDADQEVTLHIGDIVLDLKCVRKEVDYSEVFDCYEGAVK